MLELPCYRDNEITYQLIYFFSARRTEVIDDENDYYQSSNSVWLSSAEREKMQKREEEIRNAKYPSRLTQKVTLDFAGREIVEEVQDFDDAFNAELREAAESMMARVSNDANVCPTIEFDRPTVGFFYLFFSIEMYQNFIHRI